MKELEEYIQKGEVIAPDIVKVDHFLNHQINIKLLKKIGEAFKERFHDVSIDKIVTMETSGIAVAAIVSLYFDDVPVVYIKKEKSAITSKNMLEEKVHSFTKNKDYIACLDGRYIQKGERILLIDDFLANGAALKGMISLVEKAGGTCVGAGIVIEKAFMDGRKPFEEKGYRIEALARIESVEEGIVKFKKG